MWRRTALVGALTLLLLMHCSTLAGAALTNAGMLPLRDALIAQVDLPPGTYPVYEALDETPATARAMQILRCAVARDEGSPTAQWALGRAALALGDVKAAAGALRPPAGRARHNPLLYHDGLTAFSYGGNPAEVIALYEAVPPPERTSAMSDTVALAYLGRGAGGQRSTGESERIAAGRSVCRLLPVAGGGGGRGCEGHRRLQRDAGLFPPGGDRPRRRAATGLRC